MHEIQLTPAATSMAISGMQASDLKLSVPFAKSILVVERARIAGTSSSSERADLCAQLEIGQRLDLRREPTNLDNPWCIRTLTQSGDFLGYLPADITEILSRLMDEGKSMYAVVNDIAVLHSWRKVYVQVYMED